MKITYLIVIIGLLSVGPAGVTTAQALEESEYSVIYKTEQFEIRQYEPYIVAETFVEGDFDDVSSVGFRRLFDYISGNNRSQTKIEMTSPVTQEPQSEKIEMTAPVTQEKVSGRYRITFLMPSRLTMQTLPQPLDENVSLKKMPARWVAANRYSGTWSRSRYESHKKDLVEWIQDKDLIPSGEPVFARYDAPFVPWFLRRNEVLIPIEKPGDDIMARFKNGPAASSQ